MGGTYVPILFSYFNIEMKKFARTRGWCYTINNPTDDDIAFAMSLYEDDVDASYQIIGTEEAPRTGTIHLQCYIYYKNARREARMRKLLYPHHIEPQGSRTNVAAYVYCMQDGDYYEQGERPRQGHRTDLEVIKCDLKKKRPMSEIADQYFSQWCQYRRSFDEFNKQFVKYDTELIVYDIDDMDYSIREVYKNFDYNKDLFVESEFVYHIVQLASMYYSKRYRAIYIPRGYWCNCDFINKNVSKVIENARK